ncbi:MAG: hypothetical protein VBE63_18220 [Lamprobacter sp.]|uniref:hypothetical protein n=1 Tax=Lamprobacter sp. TaxID=3100796 RepID=UPI002B262648|nr:hypothetical protein [Lamprobacter sp.]MEA3641851.1 hypothetical protein [Lamprobacter sp.]
MMRITKDKSLFPWAPRAASGNRMEIMLDLSPTAIRDRRAEHDFEFWQLRTPLIKYKIDGVFPYGLDNGCFSGDLPSYWWRMLDQAEQARPVFVCLPDVVGSARRTLDLFSYFESATNGLPRALVLQNGIGDVSIPWDKIDAVFIGGTDSFKAAPEAFAAARCARMLGKWVHVGRVNTARRVHEWMGIADSIDGSGISRDPRGEQLAEVVAAIKGSQPTQSELVLGNAA